MNFTKFLMGMYLLRDKAGEGGAGGGGGAPDPAAQLKAAQDEATALKAEIEALKKAGHPSPNKPDDTELAEKVRKEREAKDKLKADGKVLENAIKFDVQGPEWLKTNASLLPKSVEGLFAQAEKENYDSAIEKTNAIKSSIVTEFFAVQANLDLLTDAQKISLAEFKALTKTDKQARVQAIYDQIFEPTFESLKKIKRAEEKSKGLAESSDFETAYKNKMMAISRKHFLKEETK